MNNLLIVILAILGAYILLRLIIYLIGIICMIIFKINEKRDSNKLYKYLQDFDKRLNEIDKLHDNKIKGVDK